MGSISIDDFLASPSPEKEKKIKGELKEIINDRMKQLQELDQIFFT